MRGGFEELRALNDVPGAQIRHQTQASPRSSQIVMAVDVVRQHGILPERTKVYGTNGVHAGPATSRKTQKQPKLESASDLHETQQLLATSDPFRSPPCH